MKRSIVLGMSFSCVLVIGSLQMGCSSENARPIVSTEQDTGPTDDYPIDDGKFKGTISSGESPKVAAEIATLVNDRRVAFVVDALFVAGYNAAVSQSLWINGEFEDHPIALAQLYLEGPTPDEYGLLMLADTGDDIAWYASLYRMQGGTSIEVPVSGVLGDADDKWNDEQWADFGSCLVSAGISAGVNCIRTCIVAGVGYGGCAISCMGITTVASVVGCVGGVLVRTQMGGYKPRQG